MATRIDDPPESEFTQRATYYISDSQLTYLEFLVPNLRTEARLKPGKSELSRLAFDRLRSLPGAKVAKLLMSVGK